MSELHSLNPLFKSDVKIQQLPPKKWTKILPKADPLLTGLLSRLLMYDPEKRLDPFEALKHEYFAELKGCKINGQSLPFLFEFTECNFQSNTVEKLLHKDDVRTILSREHTEG